jgi:hypothetical protein
LVLTGCNNGSTDDGGISPVALNGTWVKDNATNNEEFEKDPRGQTYFKRGPAGRAVITGEMISYDGTTAVIEPYGDESNISFTATIAGSTLTVNGIGCVFWALSFKPA